MTKDKILNGASPMKFHKESSARNQKITYHRLQ
jgi:hypothetical protein